MSTINIEIEENLRQQAEALFNNLGLNITSAINMFLENAVKQSGIDFDIGEVIFNKETISALEECEEMKSDTIKYKRYKTFAQAVDEVLNND